MMGTIISNTKTRFGKYRPWVLIGAVTNAIFLVLMFTLRADIANPNAGWINVGIVGGLYFLWGMTFTMNDVSYWSLLPRLSESKEDRDKLTTMVAIFASVGAFTAGGLVPMMTTGNEVNGYRMFAIVFASIFLACQLLVFFFTHDNKQNKFMLSKDEFDVEPKENNITLKDMFKILIRNKQLLVMAVIVLFYTTASGFLTAFGQNFFYFKFGYDGNLVFIFTVIYAVGTIASQFIFPLLTKKFNRSQIVKVSLFIAMIGYALFFIISNIPMNKDLCFTLLCIFGILVFGGQGTFYMAMLIMLTNTIEYDEWKNYERNDAVTFSVRPFMVKLSGAIQYGIVSLALVACGLYSITEQIADIKLDVEVIEVYSVIYNYSLKTVEIKLVKTKTEPTSGFKATIKATPSGELHILWNGEDTGVIYTEGSKIEFAREEDNLLINGNVTEVSFYKDNKAPKYKEKESEEPAKTIDFELVVEYSINSKSYTTNKFAEKPLWQRSFHDHIIRGRDDYEEIVKYIYENPIRWYYDELYSEE